MNLLSKALAIFECNAKKIEEYEEEKEKIEQKKQREKEKYKTRRKKDDIRLPAGATLGDVDDIVAYWEADGKPIFSIKKIQRLDRERKQRE